MSRLRFVFDTNLCTGCDACRVACFVENESRGPSVPDWRTIHTHNKTGRPGAPRFHLSLACQHCADPACLNGCPVRAYRIDEETGAVLLDEGRCIGCRYCVWVCPYSAPVLDSVSGTVSKCDFCRERQGRSLAPACATLCPTGALAVEERDGEMTDRAFRHGSFPGSDRHGPALRPVPLRGDRFPPAATEGDPGDPGGNAGRPGASLSLREEWPLVAFTALATPLVALVASSFFRPPALPLPALLLAGTALHGVSALHLGRPLGAWRALLGARTSPLSREILFYTLFLALLALSLVSGRGEAGRFLRLAASAAGFAFLFSVDQVYVRVRPAGDRLPHSAAALPTGAFLAALFAGALPTAVLLGLARLALYLARKVRARRACRAGIAAGITAAARVGLGFAVPALLHLADPAAHGVAAALLVVAGEVIDRLEYYVELRVAEPAAIMVNFAANRTGICEIVHRS